MTVTAANRSPSSPQTMRMQLERPLMLGVGGVLLVYIIYHFGSHKVWFDLTLIGWRLGIIIALEFLAGAISALAWWHTFPQQSRGGAHQKLFFVRLAGSALNQTIPAAPLSGELVKVLLLKERFPVAVTTAAVMSTKLAESLARALFILIGMLLAFWFLKLENLPVKSLLSGFIVIAAGIAAFMVAQMRGFSGVTKRASARLPFLGKGIARMEHGLRRVDKHLQELYGSRPKDFAASVALSLAGLSVGVVQVWLLMGWLGLRQEWLPSLAIEAFSALINFVLFVIPGSLGIQEGGKLLIFAALGLPVSAGLSIGVAFRLNSLATVAAGFIALLWLRPPAGFSGWQAWIHSESMGGGLIAEKSSE